MNLSLIAIKSFGLGKFLILLFPTLTSKKLKKFEDKNFYIFF